ncbi:MAG TPA: transcription termination/antitermination protein NusA [Clostridiaceae bacterium]|nr:transcription termination/antitermination protein NusA [Clostridiaceae bacterium]
MNGEFIEAITQLAREKNIKQEVLIEALESALVSAYKKNFGSAQNVKTAINPETGDVHVYAQKTVVDEVYDKLLEIDINDAKAIDNKYKLGDVVDIEVTPRKFGRIAAQTAKQVVVQKIREAERGILYEEFSNKENDLIIGTVLRKDKQNVYIDLGKIEASLGPGEQMPGEEYNFGDKLKLYIVEVKKTNKGPQVIVSRTHPGLVKRLFEQEVPEIFEGIVEIKGIAREAGSRTKIAVYSHDENIDPTGACIGQRGTRVQNIVDELKGEKIDVIKWSKDPEEFIASSLSPAKVISVTLNEKEKSAKVVVVDYQLSLAIGKEGQNARLAAKLTGWKIDIKSQTQIKEEVEEKEEEVSNKE